MATTYPTTLDTFTNPASTDPLNSATVPHAGQHDNLNDAVKQLEATVMTRQAAPTIASAATIAPTTWIVFVSGVTTINTIIPPAPIATQGGMITIIPTGAFATGITGNIALASTAVVSKALEMVYDPTTTKWYPSY